MRKASYLILVVAFCSLADETASVLPPECPIEGTLEIVVDPAAWADQCFRAMNTRLPTGGNSGDTLSFKRDIDLDGTDEILEARGTGNGNKQIYVFKDTQKGPVYVGMLPANPSFYVGYDRDGRLLILNIFRMGYKDVYLEQIQYKDRKFVLVDRLPMQ